MLINVHFEVKDGNALDDLLMSLDRAKLKEQPFDKLNDIELIETKIPYRYRKMYKEFLYHKLTAIASEHGQFYPRKNDSIMDMEESYCYWAYHYNDGYMPEIKEYGKGDIFIDHLVERFEFYYK